MDCRSMLCVDIYGFNKSCCACSKHLLDQSSRKRCKAGGPAIADESDTQSGPQKSVKQGGCHFCTYLEIPFIWISIADHIVHESWRES